jgi:hypothetical protein
LGRSKPACNNHKKGHQQCGICDFLIGAQLLPAHLTGPVYRDLLKESLPESLQYEPSDAHRRIRFTNDGPTAYFNKDAREYLHDIYPKRRAGHGGPFPWPARSVDPNPLDFFARRTSQISCGRASSKATGSRHNTAPYNKHEHVRESVVSRCRLCNEVGGRHFKQLLQLLIKKCLIIITMLCQCYLCTIKISINYVQDIQSRPETSLPLKTALPVVACAYILSLSYRGPLGGLKHDQHVQPCTAVLHKQLQAASGVQRWLLTPQGQRYFIGDADMSD